MKYPIVQNKNGSKEICFKINFVEKNDHLVCILKFSEISLNG